MTALNKQAHQTENERMAQSLAERNGEPVEGLRQRISELEEIATDYGMKFQKAQDALKHQALLHQSQMEAAEKRIAEHNFENRLLDNADRDIKALRQRIAELEAREVAVKQFDDFQIVHYGGSEDYAKGYIDCQNNYNKALTAAGIGVKGE
ncbi:hypothetical protein [Citrobacter freundii]|uniref:hypothetical protein n=1 Tax=Citrobacter freundii TaxID=546 RepID=UPI002B3B4572|nr:hypothetical protein [Citrobacter freundii]